MAPPDHHRTPLRRISHGSLSNLARSANQNPSSSYNDPTRLNFLIPAFSDLGDELASLHANLENLNHLSDVLETFNESFASYLYALRMNAFCVEWEQAPGDTSFLMAAKAAEEAQIALSNLTLHPPTSDGSVADGQTAGDFTYETTLPSEIPATKPTGILKNTASKLAKAKQTAKTKKAREMQIESVIMTLPLEYRGGDVDVRKVMEGVIGTLMDAEGGKRMAELVKPPVFPQAKVNKCLIALVNRKVVEKEANKGAAIYHFRGIPDR